MVTCVPCAMLKDVADVCIYPQNNEVIFIDPIFQMKKLRHRGVKYIFGGHVSSKIQSQDSNLGSQMPQFPLKIVLTSRPLYVCVHVYLNYGVKR